MLSLRIGTTKMPRGYSVKFTEEVNKADQTKLGVRLGQVCINHDIPVSNVAEYIGVSRMTVYGWFKGKGVAKSRVAKVEELLDKLLQKFSA